MSIDWEKIKSFFSKDISFGDISFGRISLKEKAIFAQNLSILLEGGITLDKALNITRKEVEGRLKKVVKDLEEGVNSGKSLSLCLQKFDFRPFFIEMIKAGEESGNLSNNLKEISKRLKKEVEIKRDLKEALTYPSIIFLATLAVGGLMVFYILPQIIPLLKAVDVELPLATRIVIRFSELIQNYFIEILVSLIVSVSLFIWLLRKKFTNPFFHWLYLHIPLVKGIVRSKNSFRFARSMGSLLSSGIVIQEAIRISSNTVDNYYYKQILADVEEDVNMGKPLSVALKQNDNNDLFPVILKEMINAGENSGKLSEVMFYISDYLEDKINSGIKNINTAIEPILLLIIGVVVTIAALAIIAPIYKFTGSLN